MVFYELYQTPNYFCVLIEKDPIPRVYVQFVCIQMLHLNMIDILTQYLNMMKYVINHPRKFEEPRIGFLIVGLQFLVIIMVELSNIIVLLCTGDTLALVGNFVSLVIITQFDQFVYASMKGEVMKKLLEKDFVVKVATVTRTTSR